tara:strand:- start:2205 stop:3170 length:966 start_codon:yes stop_codon:yes gene_type:complete
MILEKSNILIFSTLFLSTVLSILLVPKLINLGKKLNLLDLPGKRKIHTKPIVRSGGIAIFIAYIIPIIIFFNFLNISNDRIIIFLIANTLFFLIGLIDDFLNISPYIKLFFQILITSIIFVLGIQIIGIDFSEYFSLDIKIVFPKIVSYLFTIIWIVGVTNSLNWIDGLDGLASGFSIIVSLGLLIINITLGQLELALISASLAGSNIGFLKYNFHPAKIMMGDSGSYFIGFALAILALNISPENSPDLFSLRKVLLLSVPVFDMFIVIGNRLIKGNNPFYADQSHFHHRLLFINQNQTKTVLLIYLISFIFTSITVYLTL